MNDSLKCEACKFGLPGVILEMEGSIRQACNGTLFLYQKL